MAEENRNRGGKKPGNRNTQRRNRPQFKSNRGGEKRQHGAHAQRPGFREERIKARVNEPQIPSDITADLLDPSILQDLRSLSRDNREMVAKHMAAAADFMDEDPQRALKHARAAKDRAGRIGVVRETCGIAAYRAGEWKEALSELRAARRMSGGPGLLAVMADCERGLNQPERAIAIGQSPEAAQLDQDSRMELAIVIAGAHRDLGENLQAMSVLEELGLDNLPGESGARVYYFYADILAELGRTEEARSYFEKAAAQDEYELLDATDRLKELSK
ncbi:MAG: tetratricopeptide repeat protein [Corynebacterium sp.]|nr:tetratricopeptide repeat protein [Corynebacterium sp.]